MFREPKMSPTIEGERAGVVAAFNELLSSLEGMQREEKLGSLAPLSPEEVNRLQHRLEILVDQSIDQGLFPEHDERFERAKKLIDWLNTQGE